MVTEMAKPYENLTHLDPTIAKKYKSYIDDSWYVNKKPYVYYARHFIFFFRCGCYGLRKW